MRDLAGGLKGVANQRVFTESAHDAQLSPVPARQSQTGILRKYYRLNGAFPIASVGAIFGLVKQPSCGRLNLNLNDALQRKDEGIAARIAS